MRQCSDDIGVRMVRNQRGDIMVVVLIAVAITTFAASMYYDIFSQALSMQKKSDSITLLDVLENQVIWTIENDEAWKVTMANNPAAACLRVNGAVCANATNPLDVYLEDGTLLNRGNVASNEGFDYLGLACTGFSATSPNDKCPFKIEVSWTPNCVGVCPATVLAVTNGVPVDPNVRIDIRIRFSGNRQEYTRIYFDKRFQKNFIRGSIEGSLASSCRAARGTFDPKTQTCQLVQSSCPAGQVLNGFDALGNPVCRDNYFLNSGCGSTFAPVGVYVGGGFKCSKF